MNQPLPTPSDDLPEAVIRTKKEAVASAREFIRETRAGGSDGYVVSVVDLETGATERLLDN